MIGEIIYGVVNDVTTCRGLFERKKQGRWLVRNYDPQLCLHYVLRITRIKIQIISRQIELYSLKRKKIEKVSHPSVEALAAG